MWRGVGCSVMYWAPRRLQQPVWSLPDRLFGCCSDDYGCAFPYAADLQQLLPHIPTDAHPAVLQSLWELAASLGYAACWQYLWPKP